MKYLFLGGMLDGERDSIRDGDIERGTHARSGIGLRDGEKHLIVHTYRYLPDSDVFEFESEEIGPTLASILAGL